MLFGCYSVAGNWFRVLFLVLIFIPAQAIVRLTAQSARRNYITDHFIRRLNTQIPFSFQGYRVGPCSQRYQGKNFCLDLSLSVPFLNLLRTKSACILADPVGGDESCAKRSRADRPVQLPAVLPNFRAASTIPPHPRTKYTAFRILACSTSTVRRACNLSALRSSTKRKDTCEAQTC